MRQTRSSCKNASTKRWVWLSVAAAVLAWGVPSHGTAVASSGCKLRAIPWAHASFQAERLGNRVTVDISMVDHPAAVEQACFLQSPRGTGLKPSGREVVKVSVRIRIDIIGRREVRLENHVWLDPPDGTPLFLIRTRTGLDDYYQQLRFTQEGVFRRQREPASAAEASRPIESWSRLGERFYAFPPGVENCHSVLETSTLIYLLSASAKGLNDLAPMCVFHKRQLHRVSLRAVPAESVGFDYLEKKGETETRRSGTAPARKIRIESQPIGSYRGEVEELFGHGAWLYLSPTGRVPLMLSGELFLIGRVDLRLSEIHFN